MSNDLLKDFMGKTKVKSSSTAGAKIAGLLFKSQIDTHLSHILQKDKKLSTHKALQKYYEDIDGLVDTFTESYMGLYPIKSLTTEEACTGFDDPIVYFETLYNNINSLRSGIKESFLQNQIDTVQELIAQTLYRLKYTSS